MKSIREQFDAQTASRLAADVERRRVALAESGWLFGPAAATGLEVLGRPAATVVGFTATKHVAGNAVAQYGDTWYELATRCESWDQSQSQLKPEFRIGYVEVVREQGSSADEGQVSA